MRLLGIAPLVAALLFATGCVGMQSGVVWTVDSFDETVTIGDHLYRVHRDTGIYGPDGSRIALSEVPTVSDPGIGARYVDRAEVDFRSRQFGEVRVLDQLWVRRTP